MVTCKHCQLTVEKSIERKETEKNDTFLKNLQFSNVKEKIYTLKAL